jgi:hypothetical protein
MFVYNIALRTSLNTSSWNSPRLRTASLRGFASTSAKRGRPSLPSLTTLHPQLLQPSDFHSLSSMQAVRINYDTRESNEPSDIYYKAIGKNRIPFPTEARGFFYFHPGPSYAPIAGELRFRVVPTGSPTDFNQGHDLLAINQCLPWSIPLATLLSFKGYSGLASLLKCHFMPTLSSVLERVKEDKLQKARTNSTIIHALGQPLFTRVDQISITHCIAKGEELGEPRSWCMFSDHRGQGKTARRFAPYTGTSNIFSFVSFEHQ